MGITETRLQKEEITLLDRLYNLRSDESAILEEINRSTDDKKKEKEDTETQQAELEAGIQEQTTRKDVVEEQYAKIVEDLKGLDKENYRVVLEELEEEFDPQALVKKCQEKFPSKIEAIKSNITSKQEEASELKDKIAQLEIELGELDERLSNAKSDKENLDDLLKEIAKGNKNITVQQITDLLSALGFTTTEINDCGKLLLFSDALNIYDEIVQGKENAGKTMTELFNEAKQNAVGELIEDQEEIIEPKAEKEEVVEEVIEEEIPEDEQEAVTLEIETDDKEEVVEDTVEEDQDSLIELLREIDLEATPEMLQDKELEDKINLLKENGKENIDIKMNISVLLNTTMEELMDKIKKLQQSGINEFPILALYGHYTENLITNVKELNQRDIVLDEKELGRFIASAFIDPKIFKENLDIAITYGLSLKKSNGKTAIDVLVNSKKTMVNYMDAAIEAGEEEILSNNPELLSQNIMGVLARIEFVKQSGADYKKDGKYRQVIGNASKFTEQAGDIKLNSYIISAEENNDSLKTIVGNEDLINILGTYYESEDYGNEPTADEDTLLKYHSLVQMVEQVAETTKFAYKINDLSFSINKFRRNALYLLNNNEELKNEELLLVALAYNSHKTEEEIRTVAQSLGFNLAMKGV